MQIQDGKGSGKAAEVDNLNRLVAMGIIKSEEAFISENDGESYVWKAAGADIDAADTALSVTNDSKTKKLYITKVYIWVDVATAIDFHLPTYVTPAGTAITGISLNRSKDQTADATAKGDETAMSQANVILTVHSGEEATSQKGQWIDFDGKLILGYHDTLAIDIESEPGDYECSIFGYFK